METAVVTTPVPAEPTGLKVEELVTQAEECLRQLRFKPSTISRYQVYWRQFARFCAKGHSGNRFSSELVQMFLASRMTSVDEPPVRCFEKRMLVAIRVLTGVATTGGYSTRLPRKTPPPPFPAPWQDVLEQYRRYRTEEGAVCEASVERRVRFASSFIQFGLGRGIKGVDDISCCLIRDFVASHVSYKSCTVASMATDLRNFLRHLVLIGLIRPELVNAVPAVRVYTQDRIPTVWKPEEVERLLAAVDRTSPTGKRDYAILLLAARTGMRSGDIRHLKLDNINWEASSIEFTQSKTQQPHTLPLALDVGEAIIDYLKNGRPVSSAREVFLRAIAPHAAFTHTYNIMDFYRKRAGIHVTTHRQHGLHSLRHSLASRLLEVGTPIETIASVLGHSSVESTRLYTKIDISLLRRAALDLCEVIDG